MLIFLNVVIIIYSSYIRIKQLTKCNFSTVLNSRRATVDFNLLAAFYRTVEYADLSAFLLVAPLAHCETRLK